MELSLRLKTIANMVDKCYACADIGTDHGYIPIYLISNDICKKVIASDINKGPINKAKFNIKSEGLDKFIECRIGSGLTTLKSKEVNCAIVAGMGGNLIKDIVEEGKDIFKDLDYLIVQPVQNPEIFREYVYNNGYKIIEEELCVDENKFYEIIKVKYSKKSTKIDNVFYEVSKYLLENNHPLIKEYILKKIEKNNRILIAITEDTKLAAVRREEVKRKIFKLKELLEWL
ncbi:tRNA (adenine(22)-N(1))-methyltransferase [Clostridium rectalis]|uniref:tRNA (adenine(22)-N(1))-methyltransferase n=1 Tax=Clostridium rectalis TaxID=2040295 RepID=UPI000F63712C|nr:class I SAM-dependent methyltransferase [Clostridium rectalis]